MSNLKLGSLFDGSGGFPLGAVISGITPIWSSEVEPFPIRVTTKRLPSVKHLGDICKINGGTIEPVDIITFGSPCQSFSIAGKRAGLEGKSGLFYEAVRVIREMRAATNNVYPRFAVMENVPGIFSSKTQGKSDFLEVLNELCKIKDEAISVPIPENGKWLAAGNIMADNFSLAYRTIDAQHFGVAQSHGAVQGMGHHEAGRRRNAPHGGTYRHIYRRWTVCREYPRVGHAGREVQRCW
ncbi:hypothetical protein FACS1894202_02070 [Clostridia bacterium]|nr:hypothetical protein FACS1894202_02070 [Clostridia bacterium]